MEHIILLTTSFPDERLGSEAAGSFVADFAEELTQRCRVTVLAPSTRARIESRGNLRIERFAVPKLPLSLLNVSNPVHWVSIFRTLHNGQKALSRLLGKGPVDHILALWALPSGYWARRVWKRHGIPYSVWALGSDIWSLGKIPLVKGMLKNVLRDSQHRFADGLLLKEQVEALAGQSCRFLPSTRDFPINEKKHLKSTPPFRLAYLGRWHPNKGVDLLLDALKLLPDETWRKIEEIRICGGGMLANRIRRDVIALQGDGRAITLQGYLSKEEAVALFGWADYLLLPSRIESIPVVFSDAVKANVALVATPVGDLPRLFHTYHVGVLAQAAASKMLAQAIESALTQSPKQFAKGLAEARTAFDLSGIVGQFVAEVGMR